MLKRLLSRLPFAATLGLALALSVAVAFAQVTVTMNAVGGSGVTGTATLEPMGDQTRVTVTLSGFQPNTAHAGHIHTGNCETPGPVTIPLGTINAGANGSGTVTTTVNATLASLQAGNNLIAFHQAAAPPGPIVTCGNIVQAAAALPRTGGIPMLPVAVLSLGALGLGFFLRRR